MTEFGVPHVLLKLSFYEMITRTVLRYSYDGLFARNVYKTDKNTEARLEFLARVKIHLFLSL